MDYAKPITTNYKGYRFRSRLEARWAVFLSAMFEKFEYEKEGFDFGNGFQYLPDFWLPRLKCWAEVKFGIPSEEEYTKCRLLRDGTGMPVILLMGIPGEESVEIFCWEASESGGGSCEYPCKLASGHDDKLLLYVHSSPEQDCFFDSALSVPVPASCISSHGVRYNIGINSAIIMQAYMLAKSARWEHGEKPFDSQPWEDFH